MIQARWGGRVIAESNATVVVEGNHYFPMSDVRTECLTPSDNVTTCWWKGRANYYNVVVDGKISKDAAWYYAEPKAAAGEIKGRVAFWNGVEVSES